MKALGHGLFAAAFGWCVAADVLAEHPSTKDNWQTIATAFTLRDEALAAAFAGLWDGEGSLCDLDGHLLSSDGHCVRCHYINDEWRRAYNTPLTSEQFAALDP